MRYVDAQGCAVEVELLDGPCMLNTEHGEYCAAAGLYVARYADAAINPWPLVLSPELLNTQFIEVP